MHANRVMRWSLGHASTSIAMTRSALIIEFTVVVIAIVLGLAYKKHAATPAEANGLFDDAAAVSTLQELFLATVCLIYLHAGALPAAIMFGFAVSLWHRVRTEATAIVDATFETLHEAEAERQGRAGFSTVSRDGSLSLSI